VLTCTGGLTRGGLKFNLTPSAGYLAGQTIAAALGLGLKLTYGTGADQIDLIAPLDLTFVASTMQSIDLTSMVDTLGTALSFARVKLFALRVESQTDGATLTLTPDATNGWSTGPVGASSSLLLLPGSLANPFGGFTIFSAPNTTGYVVNSTHKKVDMTPNANAFTATLLIAGCSV
jgi:hypothetical protein